MAIPDRIFERLYGYTLGRSYRNDPLQACRDAIAMLMIIVGVPIVLAGFVLVTALFPDVASDREWPTWLVVGSGVILFVWSQRYERYSQTPDLVDRYRSPPMRRRTLLLYLGTLLISPVGAGVVARILVHTLRNP